MPLQLIQELLALLGPKGVLSRPEDLMLYEYDGSVELGSPQYIVFPTNTREVSEIVRLANRYQVPLLGRGAGTGLSGGAIAREGGIVVAFSRMNRVLEVDAVNRRAVLQPGVVNLDITRAVEHLGLYFAPDPSSQKSCTIGGNVSENAGGPHTLAYGVTTNHVTGLELVLTDGEIVRVGGRTVETGGYDLTGLMVGSEGTLALVTEITVRLLRKPEAVKTLLAVYETIEDATETVVDLTARAITPAACEMIDGWTLRAIEDFIHAGYPKDSAAVLLLEVEGVTEAVREQTAQITEVCRDHHAREVRVARDDRERDLLWKGRKNAFGALGRLSPSYYVQDGVIPRTRLTETLRRIEEVSRKYGFPIGNIFHAGDGNLHPLILFDQRDPVQLERVVQAAGEIIAHCVAVGGALTGEHGIGMEKNELMPLMFTPEDLALMRRVRAAFNPNGRLNPGKLLPLNKGCGEIRVQPMSRPGHGPRMSGPAQASLTRLEEIVGSAHVLTAAEALAARQVQASSPAAVVQPAEAAQVAEVIRFAVSEKLAVLPCGGGTKLAIGNPPERYDIALDLSRMNRVLAYEPADLTLGVEPGVRIDDLLGVLREQRQFLPLRGAFAGRATVGGVAAANSDSPLRHAYGTVRDYCLGMEFVTGEGVPSKSGGRVVKNVTGYDLHKLLIGSLGTLAVITRINFRTFPILPVSRTFAASFDAAGQAFGFCQGMAQSPLSPQMVEVADPGAAGVLSLARSVAGWDARSWAVLVTAAGESAVVERHGRDLAALAGAAAATNFKPLDEAAESAVLDAVREFSRLVLEAAPGAAVFRIGLLPVAMPVLHGRLSEVAARNHLGLATLTRASGVMYAALLPTAPGRAGSLAPAVQRVFEVCAEAGIAAHPALEWAPAEIKRAAGNPWGPPRQDMELMRRIKNIFDPHRVLSPGRLGGGI